MMQPKNFYPAKTENSLKILLLALVGGSLFSKLLLPYLALSSLESTHFQPWQLVTYPFIHLFPNEILSLLFNLYMLWIFGSDLISRMKTPLFLTLFFGSTIVGSGAALLSMQLFPNPPIFFGSTPVLYALLTSWVLLNKDTRMLLFFALPVKAANLLLIMGGLTLVLDLSSGHLTSFFATASSILFSYLFTLLTCHAKSPFSILAPFENRILKSLEKMGHWHNKKHTKAKIYDIKSGKAILSDEEFMDAMLTKISLHGESTLLPEEKARMEKISRSKKP